MTELSKRAMGAREMNALTGGNSCGCGCHGPSSTSDNMNANYAGNKTSDKPVVIKKDVILIAVPAIPAMPAMPAIP